MSVLYFKWKKVISPDRIGVCHLYRTTCTRPSMYSSSDHNNFGHSVDLASFKHTPFIFEEKKSSYFDHCCICIVVCMNTCCRKVHCIANFINVLFITDLLQSQLLCFHLSIALMSVLLVLYFMWTMLEVTIGTKLWTKINKGIIKE